MLCEVLEVSASGYYDWLDRPPSPRFERHEQIQAAVRQLHAESYGIYGSLKIANKLRERPDLESAYRNTIAQAMRELSLKSRIAKAFTPTTTQSDPSKPAPNELAQDFTARLPSQVGDRHHPTWRRRRYAPLNPHTRVLPGNPSGGILPDS